VGYSRVIKLARTMCSAEEYSAFKVANNLGGGPKAAKVKTARNQPILGGDVSFHFAENGLMGGEGEQKQSLGSFGI
jgi:hypothetical protein